MKYNLQMIKIFSLNFHISKEITLYILFLKYAQNSLIFLEK